MSLLLDALKRAEQEKLSRQGEREPGAAKEKPVPPNGAAALELQPAGDNRAGTAAPRAPARTDAEAANTAFQAKAGGANASKTGLIWGISIAIAVVVLGVGGYVWYMMQSLSPRMAPAARAPRPLPMALPSAQALAPPILDAQPGAAASEAARETKTSVAFSPAPSATPEPQDLVARLLQDARSPAAARPALKLERSAERPSVPPEVAAGYRQLLDGNLAAARRSYANALATASSVDAELGLATVEARSGNRAQAAMHYRRALDIDPRNGTAYAGLAALAEDAQPGATEAGLRAALMRSPDSASLHFALGNAYAAQSRWSDAQPEYYEAHRLDPAGADIAYNLAVSLDHLGQARLAADFYARALRAARDQDAQFDAAAVARRLAELK